MKNTYISSCLLLSFLIIFIYWYLSYEKEKHLNVRFFDKKETMSFFENDTDRYVDSMSSADLYARKVRTKQEYISMIKNCCTNFSERQKRRLILCCEQADRFFEQYKYNGLDCVIISKMKWNFALTQNYKEYEYENGFPHTRSDVIFLSYKTINDNMVHDDDEQLVNTLIHEKVHVYQRSHKNEMKHMLEKQGFIECNINVENKRSNPDINDKIYKDPASKECMVFTYTSNKPKNINDVNQTNFSQEHPYEKMAYEIANEYSLMSMRKFKDIII